MLVTTLSIPRVVFVLFSTQSKRCVYFGIRFLKQNQREALISQIYFWNRPLHVSDSISVHHQEPSTVHTAIGVGHTGFADSLRASSQQNLYVMLCVQC